jgi:hypothetical protein
VSGGGIVGCDLLGRLAARDPPQDGVHQSRWPGADLPLRRLDSRGERSVSGDTIEVAHLVGADVEEIADIRIQPRPPDDCQRPDGPIELVPGAEHPCTDLMCQAPIGV